MTTPEVSPATFTLTGTIDGGADPVTVSWKQGDGFDDPTGHVQTLIDLKTILAATPEGPHYEAAAEPPMVALLTAASIFDEITATGGDFETIEAQLQAESAVPDGATP